MGESTEKTFFDDVTHNFAVVYAIISEAGEELSLPFFSKISLKHAASRLKALGYRVYLAKIPVNDAKKKTRKFKAKGKHQ